MMIIIDVDDDNQDGDAKPSNLLVNRSSKLMFGNSKGLVFLPATHSGPSSGTIYI